MDSTEYIFRVLGTTRERGYFSSLDDLRYHHHSYNCRRYYHFNCRSIVQSKFYNTVACVGNPRLTKGSQGAVVVSLVIQTQAQNMMTFLFQIEQPFMMTVSAECQSYYVPRPGEEILQGRGRCPSCAAPQVSFTQFCVAVYCFVALKC